MKAPMDDIIQEGNLKVLKDRGWIPHPENNLLYVKIAFDGRIMASMDIHSINSYPKMFLEALLKHKEDEGRFFVVNP